MQHNLTEKFIKLLLAGFRLHQDKLMVSEPFLNFLGIRSLKSLVSQSKTAGLGKWIVHKINNRVFIEVDSIPEPTRKKLKLDFQQSYIKDLLITTSDDADSSQLMMEIKAEAYITIVKELANSKMYLATYYNYTDDLLERQKLAKTHAILKVVLFYTDRYPKGLIDHFYQVLKDDSEKDHNIPLETADYFYKYLRRVRRVGLPSALMHGNVGKPSNNLVLSDIVKKLIIYFKGYGNPTSARQIHDDIKEAIVKSEKLKTLIERIPDETTIRNFIATDEARNRTCLATQDYATFEAMILGYLPLQKALHPLTKVYMDGYVFQIVCEDDVDMQPVCLVGFFIMDDFSNAVICDIGDVEDYSLIRKTWDKFLRFTGHRLPSEIISDRFSSYQSKYFPNFRNFLEGNGVHWEQSSDPKRKGKLERWFGSLQQVTLSRLVGYVGEGIKSKRKNAHPAREVVLTVKSKQYLKDKNEMKRILLAAVDDYTRNSFFPDSPSPLNLFRLKKPVHHIQLQHYHLPYFFWDKHEVSIQGSMVIIKEKPIKWFYRNATFDFSLRNGSEVDAYHNPVDDAEIYLFEPGTLNYITSLKLVVKPMSARKDQTEEDRRIIATFGITKAKLHQEYIESTDKLKSELQEIAGMDPATLRKEAEAKKAADQYTGNKLGLSAPKNEPNLFDSHKMKKPKGRGPVKRKSKQKKERSSKLFDINDTLG
jgi:hypothetical protein